MSDDLFSRLFELFNQPGPINWKLAGELARHLAGESEAIDPFGVDEQRELVRLAEYQLEAAVPFPVATTAEVIVVDARTWVDRVLAGYGYLAEAVAQSVPKADLIANMSSTIAGMQVGTLVGGVARRIVASFESGFPVNPPGPLLLIGPAIDRVTRRTGSPGRDVRLWAAAEEVAHRSLFDVPWLIDHLEQLVGGYAAHMIPDADKLLTMWDGDPERMSSSLTDPDVVAELFGGTEAEPHHEALVTFLTVTSGYRHHLVKRAVGHLVPELDAFASEDGADTGLAGPSLPTGTKAMIDAGAKFCGEVERRYGRAALDAIWEGPERLPTKADLDDPVGWAARVLLDDQYLGTD
ncbi:MAG TPA: zinc-dependent metalloprotease [Acidimicrobiia bacterium]|jgi:putative hydrolase